MQIVERLAHTNRWTQRHPGEKLLLGGSLLALSVCLPPMPGAALVLVAAIAAALLGARLPAGDYVRVFVLPIGFLAASALSLAISVDLAGPGPLLSVSAAGATMVADACLRALAAMAALLLIILTTPVVELLALLRRTRLPAPIVDVILLVYRFIGLTAATLAAGRTAQANRLGYAGFRVAIRSSGLLAAALLPRVMDRAARMQTGLAARGYGGELRVLSPSVPPSPRFVALTLLLDAGIIASALAAGGGEWVRGW